MDNMLAEVLKAGGYGVAIVGIVLILRQVERMMLAKNGAGTSGNQPAQFWKSEILHAVIEATAPTLTAQTQILHEMKDTNKQLLLAITKMSSWTEELVQISRRERT